MLSPRVIPRSITSLPPAIAVRHICGLMVRPDDASAAHEIVSIAVAEGALNNGDGGKIVLHREIVDGLLRAATRGAAKDIEKAEKAGSMAGDVLLYVLRGQASNIPDFGIDKAVFLTTEMWRRHGEFAGIESPAKGAGADTVMKNWSDYRSVAHLWAARNGLASRSPGLDDLQPVMQWLNEDRGRWLPLAQGVFVAATTCALPRKGGLLLDPEKCWALDGVEADQVLVPPLRDDEREVISRFEPRFR